MSSMSIGKFQTHVPVPSVIKAVSARFIFHRDFVNPINKIGREKQEHKEGLRLGGLVSIGCDDSKINFKKKELKSQQPQTRR